MKFFFGILLIAVNLQSWAGFKDPYRTDRVDLGDAGSHITSMVQDGFGFLWVGTDSGLYRYDGIGNTFFKRSLEDEEAGLPSDSVHTLFIDKDHRLWIGTNYGLSLYNDFNNTFHHFSVESEDKNTILGRYINDIDQDASGAIWVATNLGLNKIDPHTFEVTRLDQNNMPSLPLGRISHIATHEDHLYIAHGAGLLRLDPEKGYFEVFTIPGMREHFFADIKASTKGDMWVLTEDAFYIFDPKYGYFHKVSQEPTASFTTVWEDQEEGYIWIGSSNNGVLRMDMHMDKLFTYKSDPEDSSTLTYHDISTLYQTRDGIVWAGTTAGLNKIHAKAARFNHISAGFRNRSGLRGSNIVGLHIDRKDRIWLGTNKGVEFYDLGIWRVHQAHGIVGADDRVNDLTQDDLGHMWATSDNQIIHFDRESHRVMQRIKMKPSEMSSITAAHGSIWVASEGIDYLMRIDPQTYAIKKYMPNPKKDGALAAAIIFAQTDSKGNLWVSLEGKLALYQPQHDNFTHYSHGKADDQLAGYFATGLAYDENGLWIATNKGLNFIHQETQKITRFGTQEGIPSSPIFDLEIDSKGYLWISHQKGLMRYNPAIHESLNYNIHDGLNNKFNWLTFEKDSLGNIFLGGKNGFNFFHPDDFSKNTKPPPVSFTAIYGMEQGESFIQPWRAKKVTIPRETHAKVFVAAFDYTNPAKNLYQYRILGKSDVWSLPATDNYIPLSLDPGDYTLQVRASNNDGTWNEAGTNLDIVVPHPWWLTDGALLFYLIAIPLLLFGFYKARTAHLRKRQRELAQEVEAATHELRLEKEKTEEQARKLQELDELKTQFFANVSHEFRTPLTLIIGPLETMLSGGLEEDPKRNHMRHEVMLRNARRLLRLINQLLDITKLEAGKMRMLARPGDLAKFTKPIVYAFHSLAEKKNIHLSIDLAQDVEVYFDREKIEKVLFNLLSNAFNYTPEGGQIMVRLDAYRNPQGRKEARLIIEDSGEGIPADELPHLFDRFRQADGSITRKREGTGIGLSLVRELIQLHGGDVWLESEYGNGTKAIFTLPLGKSHLPHDQISDQTMDAQNVIPSSRIAIELSTLEESSYEARPSTNIGETILIVDDLADVRSYIREAFPDYQIVEAVDGEHGLQTARKVRPDLIISDVMMPVMDGYAFCREVKADRDLNHVPFILLTAKASEEMKVEGLEIGADDYLSKPFNLKELRVRVRNLLQIRGQERSLRKSLEIAHRVQVSMLPEELPQCHGLDIAAFCQPASEVGGDYYDFITLDNGCLGLVIGDVSGKGMPAALYMTMTKGLMQAYSLRNTSPKETLTRINRHFHQASMANTFVSLLYAIIDPVKGEMTYASAGHNPIVVSRNGHTEILKSHGMAIGLDRGQMFDRVVKDETYTFHPGDTLVFYTDGITDAINNLNQSFGENRLIECVNRCDSKSAGEVVTELQTAYSGFVGQSTQFDDMTAVVIKIPNAA